MWITLVFTLEHPRRIRSPWTLAGVAYSRGSSPGRERVARSTRVFQRPALTSGCRGAGMLLRVRRRFSQAARSVIPVDRPARRPPTAGAGERVVVRRIGVWTRFVRIARRGRTPLRNQGERVTRRCKWEGVRPLSRRACDDFRRVEPAQHRPPRRAACSSRPVHLGGDRRSGSRAPSSCCFPLPHPERTQLPMRAAGAFDGRMGSGGRGLRFSSRIGGIVAAVRASLKPIAEAVA